MQNPINTLGPNIVGMQSVGFAIRSTPTPAVARHIWIATRSSMGHPRERRRAVLRKIDALLMPSSPFRRITAPSGIADLQPIR